MSKHISQLTRTGPQLGSNPGGQYADAEGRKFYVKQSRSDDHARNEVLACKLYELVGAPVVAVDLIGMKNGSLGTVSAWQTHEEAFDPENPAHRAEVQTYFAVHAWLGNWDAIGLEWDNQVRINGVFTTVDVGGSLRYRAMGNEKTPEQFSKTVTELTTMRNPEFNSGQVFCRMSAQQMADSVALLSRVRFTDLSRLITQDRLFNLLAARRQFLLSQFG